jgi:regulator of protease activity HflC (stomatin/prohibitin superfamily)
MEAAFAWVGYLVEWFGRLIPRLTIVRSTHAGVRFRRGGRVLAIPSGSLCVHWPIVTEIEIWPVARQTHNLPTQTLTTRDGRRIVVGGVVVFAITDAVAALARAWSIGGTVEDIAQVAITHVVTNNDYAHILANLTGSIQAELTRETRKKLRVYGVRVYRAAVTDFATAAVIRNIGGGPIAASNQGES